MCGDRGQAESSVSGSNATAREVCLRESGSVLRMALPSARNSISNFARSAVCARRRKCVKRDPACASAVAWRQGGDVVTIGHQEGAETHRLAGSAHGVVSCVIGVNDGVMTRPVRGRRQGTLGQVLAQPTRQCLPAAPGCPRAGAMPRCRHVARVRRGYWQDPCDMARIRRHHHHLVAEIDGLFHVVGDEIIVMRSCAPDTQQLVLQAGTVQGVQRAEGFVQQQHAGSAYQAARDGGSLRHAARKLMRIGLGEATQGHQRNVLIDQAARGLSIERRVINPSATFCRTVSQGNSRAPGTRCRGTGLAP